MYKKPQKEALGAVGFEELNDPCQLTGWSNPVRGILYDTESKPNGKWYSGSLVYFENVGSGSGKTLSECNVGMPRRLPQPEEFLIQQFAILGKREHLEIAQEWSLTFIRGQMIYAQTLVRAMSQSESPVCRYAPVENCLMSEKNRAILIEPGQDFFAYIGKVSVPLPEDFKLTLVLDGIHNRGIF